MQTEPLFSNKSKVRREGSSRLLDSQEALAFFPVATIVDTPIHETNQLAFPLSNGQWLQVEKKSLTERERYLLSLSTGDEAVYSRHPWYRFLVKGVGTMPRQIGPMQWVHVRHSLSANEEKEVVESWCEVMRSLLPNRIADF